MCLWNLATVCGAMFVLSAMLVACRRGGKQGMDMNRIIHFGQNLIFSADAFLIIWSMGRSSYFCFDVKYFALGAVDFDGMCYWEVQNHMNINNNSSHLFLLVQFIKLILWPSVRIRHQIEFQFSRSQSFIRHQIILNLIDMRRSKQRENSIANDF